MIQLRDLEPLRLDLDGVTRTDEGSPSKHHRVRPGDVLFGSRGTSRPAALVPDDAGADVVATSQLFVLRARHDRLDPAYLAWFLNTATAKSYFDAFARGGHVPFIAKGVLAELPVPLPPLDQQQHVARAGHLARDEARLAHARADHRLELVETLLLRSLLDTD